MLKTRFWGEGLTLLFSSICWGKWVRNLLSHSQFKLASIHINYWYSPYKLFVLFISSYQIETNTKVNFHV